MEKRVDLKRFFVRKIKLSIENSVTEHFLSRYRLRRLIFIVRGSIYQFIHELTARLKDLCEL